MALGANPNHFGPFDDTSAGIRIVGVHRSIYVPPQLLPHVINMEGATPMTAFNLIAAQIQNMSLMQDCSELLFWLLACATRITHGAGGTRIQLLVIAPLTPGAETVAFWQHRASKVALNLPNLSSIRTTLGAQQILGHLGQLNATLIENRNRNDARMEDKKREDRKTILKKYGAVQFNYLRALLHILKNPDDTVDENSFPEVYHQLAKCDSKSNHNVVQSALSMAAYSNNMHSPSQVTFALANVVLNPTTWCSDEVTMDPFEGLSPIQFGTGIRDALLDRQVQSVDLMTVAGANPSLADAQALMDRSIRSV
jgi:hypothetical protein